MSQSSSAHPGKPARRTGGRTLRYVSRRIIPGQFKVVSGRGGSLRQWCLACWENIPTRGFKRTEVCDDCGVEVHASCTEFRPGTVRPYLPHIECRTCGVDGHLMKPQLVEGRTELLPCLP